MSRDDINDKLDEYTDFYVRVGLDERVQIEGYFDIDDLEAIIKILKEGKI